MQSLLIFITQSPLVKKNVGGEAKELFSDTVQEGLSAVISQLSIFLEQNCGIFLDANFNQRAEHLQNESVWKNLAGEDKFNEALKASFKFFPQLVLVSHQGALKTAGEVSSMTALPVLVLNKNAFEQGTFFEKINTVESFKVIVCCIEAHILENFSINCLKRDNLLPPEVLQSSHPPCVLFGGASFENGKINWLFDL
jgi:hypothetical protein